MPTMRNAVIAPAIGATAAIVAAGFLLWFARRQHRVSHFIGHTSCILRNLHAVAFPYLSHPHHRLRC